MNVIEAQLTSRCDDCGGMIQPGQMIASHSDGWWRHLVCPPGRLDLVRQVCPVCFTERSVTGACMCEEPTG